MFEWYLNLIISHFNCLFQKVSNGLLHLHCNFALYCIVLHCIVLYCILVYRIVLLYIVYIIHIFSAKKTYIYYYDHMYFISCINIC